MPVTADHLEPEHLDPRPFIQRDDAALWYITTTHPEIVGDEYVSVPLATAVVFEIDKDRAYALVVLRERHSWSDEAVPELLRLIATRLGEPEGEVKDTFSAEVFRGDPVGPPGPRQVWWREDYVDEPVE